MKDRGELFGVVILTAAIVSAVVAFAVVQLVERAEPVVALPQNPDFEHVNARSIRAQFVTVGPVEPLGEAACVRIHAGERFAFLDVVDGRDNSASVCADKNGPRVMIRNDKEVRRLP